MTDTTTPTKQIRVSYDAATALLICELIAEGKTVSDIAATPGLPSRNTIYRWLTVYPKFFDAFERAKELSAMSFEEEALGMARRLAGPNDFTGVKVQAYNYAMQQLRWSASRRDKSRYGNAVAAVSATIPIQINTTLNLGQEGQPPATDTAKSIYTVEATVNVGGPGVVEEEDESVLDLVASGEVVDLSAEEGDNGLAFGVPEKERQQLYHAKDDLAGDRRRVKRKSEADIARTAAKRATLEAKRKAKENG